ncbi:bifunctional glutamate N-acetyltransferase/amino-acid acetyltransferase ArgJ [Deinococcus cellulosilyticus]|uniref:Arginine biosynthesis bifunctional protein ArgJ n=1 Tax=Deinococcus cellulosilyticus (strain DSM 18568 / NBRC 106333 / KACC 11606 / 5516J-15) TaxID=1223518 RepID=A0A511N5H5_DEIC1|nr:bifunctional glutamate N-acetyltransferase/amino-acid acetyltransferase ArgJ [Deinococcus cellulosilyticus]GEM48084.1 arginine biosynthesis bifunctional protein ArgJ 2 [Deinococcus cellulosilyticus NBRC 106333 = KACC 11606]
MTLAFQPRGFKVCARNIGIKQGLLDFTVIASEVPASGAAVFTQSAFCGSPIIVGREHVKDGVLQAFVINSGNSNVATGEQGIQNAREIVRLVADELGIKPEDILPSSTGVIGRQLPMDIIRAGIQGVGRDLKDGHLEDAAVAIMTTDTRPKVRSAQIGDAVLVGMAKGSGMIEPNMATMLSYFVTDAKIDPETLQSLLRDVVNLSFNMVSVDTDTSTSDTVAMMANGLAGEVDLEEFRRVFTAMAIELAQDIARDGEGATKLIEVRVKGANSFRDAKALAKSIVNSPLVKTAIFGTDPNWGRIAMALGKVDTQDTRIDPYQVQISFGDLMVYDKGNSDAGQLDALTRYLQGTDILIDVHLNLGSHEATVWGCDLTYDYVKINGEYTT